MLPKQFRLTVTDYYGNPHGNVRFRSKRLLLFSKQSAYPFARFGFRIPKSVDKRSSERHRMRRMLVERIRPLLPQAQGARDALIHVAGSWKKEDDESVAAELVGLLRSSGIL